MIRSFAFTTKGSLHTKDIDMFLMPTLLADTNLFLWIDLEAPTKEEVKTILENVFHFHPLSIEDCVQPSARRRRWRNIRRRRTTMFTPYLFMVIHAVDYSRQDGLFATSELDFFLGKNFLVTYHEKPLRNVSQVEDRCHQRHDAASRARPTAWRIRCSTRWWTITSPRWTNLSMEIARTGAAWRCSIRTSTR